MPWQFSVLILYIACVSQTLVQRRYAQDSKLPLSLPPTLAYVIGIMPLSIIIGLIAPHHVHWSMHLLLLLLTEGFLIGLYNWLSFKALAHLTVAQFLTIFQSYELVVIALSWPLLHEGLTAIQASGAVLLLGGALLAVNAPRNPQTKHLTSVAILFAIASALTLGSGLVAEKAALRSMDYGAYFIIGFGFQTLFLALFAAKDINRRTLSLLTKKELKTSTLYGVVTSFVGFSYIYAIVKSDNVSLIATLAAFALPLTVVAGYFFLHERENTRLLWLATGLACIGLVISAL